MGSERWTGLGSARFAAVVYGLGGVGLDILLHFLSVRLAGHPLTIEYLRCCASRLGHLEILVFLWSCSGLAFALLVGFLVGLVARRQT